MRNRLGDRELSVSSGRFIVAQGMRSWALAWVIMLPVVLLAAPAIRRLTDALTQ
ncbi:MAG TPA: DUF2798 domain-containing protein [Xanthobacteraceae bacterium]|nr:DUF2798 domain-containing protein [Xanthobacteraceae bacterium]